MPAAFSLGAGDPLGFDGDVSSAKLALAEGLVEPVFEGQDGTTVAVLELRIHGVGGSSPLELLEQQDYVQVGGDGLAQFIRRWGARLLVRWPLEGYWWGGLTSRPASRALWALLTPLLFANVAGWTAPAPSARSEKRPWAGDCLATVMRWGGYLLTLTLMASVTTISLDVFGWQCGTAACRPGWLGWTPSAPGPRLALFALVPVAVLAVLGYVCQRTLRAYEPWRMAQSPVTASRWPLTWTGFWHGLAPVRRQLLLHLAGAAGLISLQVAWLPAPHPAGRYAAITAALAVIALPVVLLGCPQARRTGDNPYAAEPPGTDRDLRGFDGWCAGSLIASAALLAALLIARLWWAPSPPTSAVPGLLPGDAGIWAGLTAAMGLTVIAALVLTWAVRPGAPPSAAELGLPQDANLDGFKPFAGGFLPPVALGLAFVLGGIWASGMNLVLARVLIDTRYQIGPGLTGRPGAAYPVELPWPLFAFMTGFLVMAAALAVVILALGVPWFLRTSADLAGRLAEFYPPSVPLGTGGQRRRVARAWTLARVADHVGLLLVTLGAAAVAGVVAFYLVGTQAWVVTWVPGVGQWAVAGIAGLLWGFTWQAFSSGPKRREIGVVWDVGTFWPRACQPFAPPCYMERSVPEVVNRLTRLLSPVDADPHPVVAAAAAVLRDLPGGEVKGGLPEDLATSLRALAPECDWVLVNGYSQGTSIAAAVIAQLPEELREKMLLLTVGAPLRRLFGRAFPAYFGPACLAELHARLGSTRRGAPWRWLNAVRPSDYVGGYVFTDPHGRSRLPCTGFPAGTVDRPVIDPPCVVPDDTYSQPTIHAHLDFWPDPQVAVLTRWLIDAACTGP